MVQNFLVSISEILMDIRHSCALLTTEHIRPLLLFGLPLKSCRKKRRSLVSLITLLKRLVTNLTTQLCIVYFVSKIVTFKLTQFAGVQGKKHSADAILNSVIYPVGSRPDDSPLFMLCMNDTCSFTWTGDEHINQVWTIFHSNIAHSVLYFHNIACDYLWQLFRLL